MNAASVTPHALPLSPPEAKPPEDLSTREAFDGFVAGTLFREMLKSMRTSMGETPYFGNGQANQIFRDRLDGELADRMAATGGKTLTQDLYEAFGNQTGLK
ncbi:rod-binding protein [Alienimonas sp. DA493]|uniref:rod-binding protein n=1 Tax=Alienimonas sp. DA493 TaxID=3373605 RepID=UPI003753F70E